MTAIASPNAHLALPAINVRQPLSSETVRKRFDEWFEGGILIALTGVAVIALSIPVALVVMSIVNVLSWVIGRIW